MDDRYRAQARWTRRRSGAHRDASTATT